MEEERHQLLGLGSLGQNILFLIKQGKSEQSSVVLKKASDGELVTYLLESYQMQYPLDPETKDIHSLNSFFQDKYVCCDKKMFGTQDGFLFILYIILEEVELNITRW